MADEGVVPSGRQPAAVAGQRGAGRSDGEAALPVLCRALLEDLDGLTDQLTLMILERDDVYTHLGVPVRDDLRNTCHANLERLLTLLAGDLPDDVDPAGLTVDTGRRRARQGVPLEVILRAYRLCGRLLWERLLDTSRRRFGGSYDVSLLEAADQVWRIIDNSSARLVTAYRTEEDRLRGLDLGRRYSVVEGLLEGRGRDPAFARDAARVLGLPEDQDLVCVVVAVEEPGEDARRTPREALLAAGLPSVWHTRLTGTVGLVPCSSVPTVAAAMDACARGPVGVSPVVTGLARLDTAHRWAGTALRTLPAGSASVAVLDDRLPEALLAGAPDLRTRLRDAAFGALLELPDGDRRTLLATLEATLDADGSPSRAAAALYCHRNTVMYRLARIEALTGRRIADPRDRLLLGLGLLTGPGA